MHRSFNNNILITIKATQLVRLNLKIVWKVFSLILWKSLEISEEKFYLFLFWSLIATTVGHFCEDGILETFSSLLKAA